MKIDIDIEEILDNIDIKYSSSKDTYININGSFYSKEQALEIAYKLINNGNEILYLIKDEIIRKGKGKLNEKNSTRY